VAASSASSEPAVASRILVGKLDTVRLLGSTLHPREHDAIGQLSAHEMPPNFGESMKRESNFGECTFHELRTCRSELHTSRGRKRKNRIFEPSQAFDTPLIMPPKNLRFLCRSRPRFLRHLKGA
jgi:hypothetical protein